MRPTVTDINAYNVFKRGEAAIVRVLQHAPAIIVCATLLGELLDCFAAMRRQNADRSELTKFLSLLRSKMVASTAATADLYSLVHVALRGKDKSVSVIDLLIAARSLEHGAALRTLDAHFQNIDGLRGGATVSIHSVMFILFLQN